MTYYAIAGAVYPDGPSPDQLAGAEGATRGEAGAECARRLAAVLDSGYYGNADEYSITITDEGDR
jgi:hypothetical protein